MSDEGLVAGLAAGTTEISAVVGGFEARATVAVAPPPRIELSADTVQFAATGGGADPAPDSVRITNVGGFSLVGLAIDSVVYGVGADGWLVPQLGSSAAPATLTLRPMVNGVTQAGQYVATVWLFGIDADNSPAPLAVTLALSPNPATALVINDGDGQTATVGTSVVTPPLVLVTDAFGNPVGCARDVRDGRGGVSGARVISDTQARPRTRQAWPGLARGPSARWREPTPSRRPRRAWHPWRSRLSE